MDYKTYNCICFMTSFLAIFVLLYKFKDIDFCSVLLLAALFSTLWRALKLYKGEKYIEHDNHKRSHLLFNLDFIFAVLALLCVIFTGKVNNKFLLLILCVFFIAWLLELTNLTDTGDIIHTFGHFLCILVIILTYYFNIY